MRVLIALGGNAMTAPDGNARAADQRAAVERCAPALADLVARGHDLVLTHGNGPQVGNLLVKNELAAAVVPPVPLDWCGAQTQATIGRLLLDALDNELASRGLDRRTAALVTRTLVDGDDPGFTHPTKPIGRYLPGPEAAVLAGHGQVWADRGERGWRRMVASPEPLEVLDAPAAAALLAAGFVVVCAGGGGIPTVRVVDRGGSTRLVGAQAVIDKDLTAAVLASALAVDVLVIATDVEHAVLGFGTPSARPLGRVTPSQLRAHAADGAFGGGSMGPKVEAVCRFVEAGAALAAITSLDHITAAVDGTAGTVVTPDPRPAPTPARPLV
ncbi:MAG: carbamate kinase [Kineosporiaceae bacterium]